MGEEWIGEKVISEHLKEDSVTENGESILCCKPEVLWAEEVAHGFMKDLRY